MRVVAFSDLHADNFRQFASIDRDGYNTRLMDCVDCLYQMMDYCITEDIRVALYGGDMFHTRGKIDVPVFNVVHDALTAFRDKGIHVIGITGNHDMDKRNAEETSVRNLPLQIIDGVDIVSDRLHDERLAVFGWGFRSDTASMYKCMAESERKRAALLPKHKDVPTVLLLHHGIGGAKVGSHEYKMRDPITPGKIPFKQFDFVLLGHYHKHQQMGSNMWYIGSMLHHNMGDTGDVRGFLDVDFKTGELKQIETISPCFWKMEWPEDDIELDDYEGDFVKFCVRPKDRANFDVQYPEADRDKILGACTVSALNLIVSNRRAEIEVDAGFPVSVDKYADTLDFEESSVSRDWLIQNAMRIHKKATE